MADLLEVIMVVSFGLSWPLNIRKLYLAKTAQGVSVMFYCLIFVGYLFGLASKAVKLMNGIVTPGYVWFFYSLNALMVFSGILLYFHNLRLDKAQGK